MGLFGSKYRYKPSDYSNWQMDPMAIDQQDLRGSGGATGGGMIRGDTAVQKEYQPNLREGGNRIDGRDALSLILASVSDAMARNRGYEANASDNVWAPRMNAMQMAREAQAAQQARMEGREDFSWQLGEKAKYEKPPSRNFEDNAGNQWTIGPNGPELVYADPIPKMYIQGDQAVQISNPFAQPRQAQPQQDYGADLPEGYSIRGGATPPASPPFQAPFRGGIPRRRR